MKVPKDILFLAGAEVRHPIWLSSEGEEYHFIATSGWIITNEKIGPYRIRTVCKAVQEVKVSKRWRL